MSTATRIRSVGAATASALVLLLSAQLAAAIPAETRLIDAGDRVGLDYDALPQTVSPLSASFIADVLGRPVPVRPDAASDEVSSASAATGTVSTAPSAAREGPINQTTVAPNPPGFALDHEATNDDMADARVVDAVDFSASTDASSATREPGEPSSCAPVGDTVWYRWTPEDHIRVVATTQGTDGVATLAVFQGDTPADLQPVGCEYGVAGPTQLILRPWAGTTYWFQVTGPLGLDRVGFTLTQIGDIVEIHDPSTYSPDDWSARQSTDQVDHYQVWMGAVSDDGRHVLVVDPEPFDEHDHNGGWDIVLIDTVTGERELISRGIDGHAGQRPTNAGVAMTPDGRYVVFSSPSPDLVPDDSNGAIDTFVRDRLTGDLEMISVTSEEEQRRYTPDCGLGCLDDDSHVITDVSISDDGRFVTFETQLPLDPRDPVRREDVWLAGGDIDDQPFPVTPWEIDAYLRDRVAGTTEMLAIRDDGTQYRGWYNSMDATVSGDGSIVVFATDGPLVDEDTDHQVDHYVRDLTGRGPRTTLLSTAVEGVHSFAAGITQPVLTPDGRFVVLTVASQVSDEDDNTKYDVVVHDRATGAVERVTVPTGAVESAGYDSPWGATPGKPSISADGRYVTFISDNNALYPGDRPRAKAPTSLDSPDHDAFVRDRLLRTTTMLSLDPDGVVPDLPTDGVRISRDGRHIALLSSAVLTRDPRQMAAEEQPSFLNPVRLYLHRRAVTSS